MKSLRDHLPLAGDKFEIRPIVEADFPALYALSVDADLNRYIVDWKPPPEFEQWISKSKHLLTSSTHFAIGDVQSGAFLGRVTLGSYIRELGHHDYELQVWVTRSEIGSHLGRRVSRLICERAFSLISAKNLFAVVHPSHPRSMGLVTELGFREVEPEITNDGTLKARVFCLCSQ